MRKKLLFYFVIIHLSCFGQISINNDQLNIIKDIPQENIFVHYNTSLLFSGEYFYYKVYCKNDSTNNFSNFSKIAYVELIGVDRKPVFKHKIKLESGIGQGDFFIPTSVPSGSYKVIAYTQWMRNGGKNYFFKADINIINPFEKNKIENIESQNAKDSLEENINKVKISNLRTTRNSNNTYIELKTNGNVFSNREKVYLTVNDIKNQKSFGKYSISIRRIDTIQVPNKHFSDTYIKLYSNIVKSESSNKENSVFLPELRGQLLSGKVLLKNNNTLASNVSLSLSIPGKEFIFKVVNTNNSGMFFFNLDEEYENQNAIIQVVNDEKEKFEIIMNHKTNMNYDDLVFSDFKISSKMKDYILQRNIYNQIENAYSSIKKDTIDNINSIVSFYNSAAKEYYLDDYTRFPTLNETIVEVIEDSWISQKKGKSTFQVRDYENTVSSDLQSLVLVDGILVQNHNELIDFDAKSIKKINIVRGKYVYGLEIFNGIVSIETFSGNYENNGAKKIRLFKPLTKKNYFKQVYDNTNKLDRIPDYRNQLLWEPNFDLDEKEAVVTFFTSDNDGEYEICLEGFTNQGKPVSIRKVITVK